MKTILFAFILSLMGCSEPVAFDSGDNDDGRDGGLDSDSHSDFDSNGDDSETQTESNSEYDTDTQTDEIVDGGGNPDTDTVTDTETETSTDTATGSDTGTSTGDTETGSDTAIDTDTDTDTETGTDGNRCPWECKSIASAPDAWRICDLDPINPNWVQNWNFECEPGEYCCQPIGATDEGALTEYCLDHDFECLHDSDLCPEKNLHLEYYCNSSTSVCCEN